MGCVPLSSWFLIVCCVWGLLEGHDISDLVLKLFSSQVEGGNAVMVEMLQ